jgi:hypothetical protein
MSVWSCLRSSWRFFGCTVNLLSDAVQDVRADHRGPDVLMTKHLRKRPDVMSVIQEMVREGVTQGSAVCMFGNAGRASPPAGSVTHPCAAAPVPRCAQLSLTCLRIIYWWSPYRIHAQKYGCSQVMALPHLSNKPGPSFLRPRKINSICAALIAMSLALLMKGTPL